MSTSKNTRMVKPGEIIWYVTRGGWRLQGRAGEAERYFKTADRALPEGYTTGELRAGIAAFREHNRPKPLPKVVSGGFFMRNPDAIPSRGPQLNYIAELTTGIKFPLSTRVMISRTKEQRLYMCRAAPACTKPGYASQSGANRHWNNTCLLNPNRTKRNRGRAGTVTTTDDAEDDAEEEAEAEVEEEAEDDVSVVSEAS